MAYQKKIPMRKCTGCGEMFDKRELIRIVKAPETNEITVDKTGKKPGRGAYICGRSECLAKAKKAGRLEKAFSCRIPPEIYEQLSAALAANS